MNFVTIIFFSSFTLILQDEKFVLAYIDYLSHLNGESCNFLCYCISLFLVIFSFLCGKLTSVKKIFSLSRAKIPPPEMCC